MEKQHSKIGASSAHRWMACPGSVQLSAQAPPQPINEHAQRGTAAHWVIEQYFTAYLADKPCVLDDFIGLPAPNGVELNEEDINSVRVFVDIVHEILKTGKYVLHVEAEFDLSDIHKDLFGTADIVLMESNMKRLKVLDYKHGSGVPVEVVENKQLKFYALGAIQFVCAKHKIDYLSVMGWGQTFGEVEIAVVQPRCRHKDGGYRRWVVPADSLDQFATDLLAAALETEKPKPTFKTGDHCRWCPAQPICRAFNGAVQEVAKTDFTPVSDPVNLKLPRPEMLSKDEIAKVLRFADVIESWLKAVEAHAQVTMEHGEDIPGFKLVQKKTNRAWKDEDAAKEALSLFASEEDLYEKKFLTPAKAEKLLGKQQKKIVEDLCFKPEGGVTVAPDHDPREEVKGSAQSDFQTQE